MHPDKLAHKGQYFTIFAIFQSVMMRPKKKQTQTKLLYTSCRMYYKPPNIKMSLS